VDALPKKFHSQETRSVNVSLRAGVRVTLDVRYYHRVKDSRRRRRNRKAKHGLYPTQVECVEFVADGAAWIWNRVPGLVEALGLRDDQVQQLIDFWHAVEYLGKLADSSQLDATARKRWATTQKKRLRRGEIGSVVDAITELTKRRRSKDQTTWLNYFITHGLGHRRMDHSRARHHHMPIGSGAIESAIRRCHQSLRQRQRDLLAPRKCRNHDPPASLDQSRTSRRTLPPNNLRHPTTRPLIPTFHESALADVATTV
jgi:hypothetical protein